LEVLVELSSAMYSPPPLDGFSPPPLDGFSPPPMSDFSPPPLSDLSPLRDFPPPSNGFSTGGEETEEESDFNFGLTDSQYDLTGLSDKINRLQLEKMKSLPPREILELKRESSGLFPIEVAADVSDEQSDSNVNTKEEHLTIQVKDSFEFTSQDLVENISSEEGPKDEYNANLAGDEVYCDNNPDDDNVLENPPEEEPVTEENVEREDTKSLERLPVELPAEEEETSKYEAETVDIKTEVEVDFPEEVVAEIDDTNDACWGEFPVDSVGTAGESWSNFPPVTTDEWSIPAQSNMDLDDRGEDLEFDESEDDDFGDFGEASEQVNSIDATVESTLFLELKELRENSNTMLESVYSLSSGGPGDEEEEEEEGVKTSLEEAVLRAGEIFEKIANPASAPALEHQWRDSCTYKTLLLTLGIDSSSNLEGEEWRSSAGRLAPRSAASLMTPGLLTPQAVSDSQETADQKSPDGDSITPAQFDWNKSGLTNPLSDNDVEKSSPDPVATSKPVVEDNNNKEGGNKLYKDHVKREAQNILDGLPLLNFMSSNVLMFPTKSVSKVKHKQNN